MPNWPIIEIFAFSKSWVGVEFWLVDTKLLNRQTKTLWQNDCETEPGKSLITKNHKKVLAK